MNNIFNNDGSIKDPVFDEVVRKERQEEMSRMFRRMYHVVFQTDNGDGTITRVIEHRNPITGKKSYTTETKKSK